MSAIQCQWFVPGKGIDRHVISADIQRYLGNDATVRPGPGTGENTGVPGYWIKAYRNLTSAMIADLQADSRRWSREQLEQQSTGIRGSYESSSTYQQGAASKVPGPQRRGADSPSLEGQYGGVPARDRMPASRGEERRPRPADAMQIDSPSAPQPDRRYGGQPGRGAHPMETRGFAPVQESRPYPQDAMMSDAYGRPPVTSSYSQDPRYAPSYPQQANDGGMPGFGRQPPPSNYYVPVSSSYDAMPSMPGRPQDPSQYGGPGYGQPPQQQQPLRQDHHRDQREPRDQRDPRESRDPRDPRDPRDSRDPRDPRYGGQEYNPSYSYPSPAATVSSVNPREREPITSPPQSSMYSQPAYSNDQFGRPAQAGAPMPQGYAQPTRDSYTRERPAPSAGDTRDARRRRH